MNLHDWLKKQPEYRERRRKAAGGWRHLRSINKQLTRLVWKAYKEAEREYVDKVLHGYWDTPPKWPPQSVVPLLDGLIAANAAKHAGESWCKSKYNNSVDKQE